MALKNFKDQKFRKKDGMPYGYKPMAEEDTREAQYNMAQQVEQPTIDNTQSIAELRKARNNPGMQEYLNSEEHKRKQREYSQRALELARSKSSSNSDAKPNAGDDRTTAYKQPQTVSDYSGLGTLPTYSGMNIAANGADIDYSEVNKKATENGKGWKGLSRKYNEWLYANNQETEQEYSKRQNDYYNSLDAETKQAVTDMKQAKDVMDTYASPDMAGVVTDDLRNADKKYYDAKKKLSNKGYSDQDINDMLTSYIYVGNETRRKTDKAARKEALENGNAATHIAYNAADILVQPVAGLAATADAIGSRLTGQRVDTNSDYWELQNFQRDVEETENELIKKNLDKQFGEDSFISNAGTFAYNTGMSIGKSWTSLATGQGVVGAIGLEGAKAKTVVNLVTLPQFGGSAFASTLEDARERGLNDRQAYSLAFVSGMAEMGTEVFSLDNLWDIILFSTYG